MTDHIGEEQLVLHYYGESAGSEGIDAHLAVCEQCRQEYRCLQVALNLMDSAPAPDRGPTYGEQVWQRMSGRILFSGARRAPLFRRFRLAAAVACLMACAYLAGRMAPSAPRVEVTAMSAIEARQQLLLLATSDHLERARIALIELTNAPQADAMEIEDLVASNRLLRGSADRAGETAVALLLDELERVLIEAARSPATVNTPQTADILFKIRVFDEGMRQPGRETL